MNEDFLHYVWKFQKFTQKTLQTVSGEVLFIEKVGTHNFDAGPDFLFGKANIGNQSWAGHIEIHTLSSQWYNHKHEKDIAYDNVILHVVWEYDRAVYRKDQTVIPTLELKGLVPRKILDNYRALFRRTPLWIQCENDFGSLDEFLVTHWLERLFLERLEQKWKEIHLQCMALKNNWEAVFFRMLSKNFGLKVNGVAFLSMATSVSYRLIQKNRFKPIDLEALLLGQAGLLSGEKEDAYFQLLQKRYRYVTAKYKLTTMGVVVPKFFRLRPPNFPTIRLSQLARLLHQRPKLFSEMMEAKTKEELYDLFEIKASDYWDTHYNFQVVSAFREKKLSRKFIDLLIINTIIPIKFGYAICHGKDLSEDIMQLARSISPEQNKIVRKFEEMRLMERNAQITQGVLQLKDHYCDKKRCTQCEIGNALLKK